MPKSARKTPQVIGIEVGDDDVGGFDVAVQQALLVGIVQRAGHGGDDGDGEFGRHSCRVALLHQLGCIGSVDVVHRDPQLPVVFASVVYSDDVGMAQSCRQVGFADEPLTKERVAGDVGAKNLQGIAGGAAADAGPGRPRPFPRTQSRRIR